MCGGKSHGLQHELRLRQELTGKSLTGIWGFALSVGPIQKKKEEVQGPTNISTRIAKSPRQHQFKGKHVRLGVDQGVRLVRLYRWGCGGYKRWGNTCYTPPPPRTTTEQLLANGQ